MKVNIMPCRFPLAEHEWPLQLRRAAESCGDVVTVSQKVDLSADIHVFWGMKRAWGRAALRMKKPSIIVERAYLGDRRRWHALGWDGLNGRADFRNHNAPADRWEKFWWAGLKPWVGHTRDDAALIVGQVPGDAAMRGVCPYAWAQQQAEEAKKRYSRVWFRPHPLCRQQRALRGVPTFSGSLEEAFASVGVVITHSSNVGVLAIMEGLHVVATDRGSMVYGVASHSVNAPLIVPNREPWGRAIAYAQWLPEELGDGTAWRHITGHLRA